MARSKQSSAAAKKGRRPRQTAAELAPLILEKLPGRAGSIARALDRNPSDGTVRRALANLVESGAAEKDGSLYKRCRKLPDLATPPGADDEAKELHAELLEACREQGTWRDHDIHLLNDLVMRDQDARECRLALEIQGRFTNSKGRIYAHPAIDKERDARRDVQALRAELVLTPDARKKHGKESAGEGEKDEFDF